LRKIQSYYAQFESALEENDKTEIKKIKCKIYKEAKLRNFRFSLERENEF